MSKAATHRGEACKHEWVSRFCAAPYCAKCRLIMGTNERFQDPYEEAVEIACRAALNPQGGSDV